MRCGMTNKEQATAIHGEKGLGGFGAPDFVGVPSTTLRTGSSRTKDALRMTTRTTTAKAGNGAEQATAKNKQRQRTSNDEIRRFWLRQNDERSGG
jgi:hypothetical protein